MTIRHAILLALLLSPLAGCDSAQVVANASAGRPVRTVSSTQAVEATFDDIKFEMELNDPFQR